MDYIVDWKVNECIKQRYQFQRCLFAHNYSLHFSIFVIAVAVMEAELLLRRALHQKWSAGTVTQYLTPNTLEEVQKNFHKYTKQTQLKFLISLLSLDYRLLGKCTEVIKTIFDTIERLNDAGQLDEWVLTMLVLVSRNLADVLGDSSMERRIPLPTMEKTIDTIVSKCMEVADSEEVRPFAVHPLEDFFFCAANTKHNSESIPNFVAKRDLENKIKATEKKNVIASSIERPRVFGISAKGRQGPASVSGSYFRSKPTNSTPGGIKDLNVKESKPIDLLEVKTLSKNVEDSSAIFNIGTKRKLETGYPLQSIATSPTCVNLWFIVVGKSSAADKLKLKSSGESSSSQRTDSDIPSTAGDPKETSAPIQATIEQLLDGGSLSNEERKEVLEFLAGNLVGEAKKYRIKEELQVFVVCSEWNLTN